MPPRRSNSVWSNPEKMSLGASSIPQPDGISPSCFKNRESGPTANSGGPPPTYGSTKNGVHETRGITTQGIRNTSDDADDIGAQSRGASAAPLLVPSASSSVTVRVGRPQADHLVLARAARWRKKAEYMQSQQAKWCSGLFAQAQRCLTRVGTRLIARKCGKLGPLIVVRSREGSEQKRMTHQISATSMLDISFEYGSACAVAKQFAVHECSVRRLRVTTSGIYMALTACAMTSVVPRMQFSKQRSKFIAVSTHAWDETQQNVSLNMDHRFSREAQRSSWQVLVSLASLTCALIDVDGECTISSMTPARAPVALINTRGPCIIHGLYYVPQVVPFEKATRQADREAYISIAVYTSDGASSNPPAVAHGARKRPRTLSSAKLCSSHTNCHIDASVMATAGLGLVGLLYSHSLLLRMGGYFARLVHAVESFVDGNLQVKHWAPPDGAAAYAEQVCR